MHARMHTQTYTCIHTFVHQCMYKQRKRHTDQGGDLGGTAEQRGTVPSKNFGGGDGAAYIPQNFRNI